MDKIEFLKETVEQMKKLLRELEQDNAPIDAIEIVKESVRTNKVLLEDCMAKEIENRVVPFAEAQVDEGALGLTVGRIFKNYKELCRFMGWKTTGGDYKKARIKELDSLCAWHNEGYKFVIDKVFEIKKDIVDGRSKNNIYIDSAEALIIHNLKKSANAVTFITVGNLGEYVGLFNDEYQYADHDSLKVDFTIFNSFKKTTNAEAKRILDRCLKSMENRKLIESSYTRIIVSDDGEIRGANAREKKVILNAENKIMKDLGCLNFIQVKNRKLLNIFIEKVKEEVISNGIEDFESSFKGYEIVSTKKLVVEAEKQLATQSKKQELNGLFIDKLNSTFQQKHEYSKNKQLESHGFGEAILKYEASEEYKPTVNKLIDELIKLK